MHSSRTTHRHLAWWQFDRLLGHFPRNFSASPVIRNYGPASSFLRSFLTLLPNWHVNPNTNQPTLDIVGRGIEWAVHSFRALLEGPLRNIKIAYSMRKEETG